MNADSLSISQRDAARFKASGAPDPFVVVVAGSGLGGLADLVEDPVVVGFDELPDFPRVGPAVQGHAGRIIGGLIGEIPVAVFQGRVHSYQGASSRDAAYPAIFAGTLGADTLIVTNAAGGISSDLSSGDVVLIRDHINLTGDNPLVGWPGPVGGTPFVSMGEAYDQGLRRLAHAVAAESGYTLREGVYAGLLGPTYETPAEVEFLRVAGADIVGMSTVPEVIVARAHGLRVLGLSLVTNVAGATGISHAEVLEAGKNAEALLTRLVASIIERI